MKITSDQLAQRQSLPLEGKVMFATNKIREWYDHWAGQVYVSFSGGKDSTVLLHLVRSFYPDVPAVFVDTGLEYPEIREFVKETENVVWLKPKMTFKETLEKYGYPIISKSVSMAISRYRNTKNPIQKQLRLYGGINPNTGRKQVMGVIPKKWRFLIKAPFKISDACCEIMKKNPIKKYNKQTGLRAYIGTMASDGWIRNGDYLKRGCNIFDATMPQGRPLSVWMEKDIWDYIKSRDISYSKIYDLGETRTGCMFCMFGIHLEEAEKEDTRFDRMRYTHPKQYEYCMNKLGLQEVIEYIQKGTTCSMN